MEQKKNEKSGKEKMKEVRVKEAIGPKVAQYIRVVVVTEHQQPNGEVTKLSTGLPVFDVFPDEAAEKYGNKSFDEFVHAATGNDGMISVKKAAEWILDEDGRKATTALARLREKKAELDRLEKELMEKANKTPSS